MGQAIGVARASLEELLLDYEDFIRQKDRTLWGKKHSQALETRALAYRPNRSYATYKTYFEEYSPEVAANAAICLIHQANYLLDQQLRALATPTGAGVPVTMSFVPSSCK